jgi:hypothetical protein
MPAPQPERRSLLAGGTTGGMIHSTVPPEQVNRATVHATVSELWHVLSGRAEIWRRDESGEEVTVLTPGVRCITMPPWPRDAEATQIEVRGCRQRQSARCLPPPRLIKKTVGAERVLRRAR